MYRYFKGVIQLIGAFIEMLHLCLDSWAVRFQGGRIVYIVGLLFYMFFSLLFARADALFSVSYFSSIFNFFDCFFLIYALFIFVLYKRSWFVLALCMGALLFFHSLTAHYAPSFLPNTPFEDYFLSQNITANWTFSVAQTYGRFTWQMIIIALAFLYSCQSTFLVRTKKLNSLLISLAILCVCIVVGVAYWQAFFDFSFLTSGSGSAISSRRVPSLFEDSAASTLFFSFVSNALLLCVVLLRRQSIRFAAALLWVGITFLAIYSLGRSYILALGPGIIVCFCIVQKSFRYRMATLILLGVFGAAVLKLYPSKGLPLSARTASRINQTILSMQNSGIKGLLGPRYTHLKAQIWGLAHTLPDGAGLGSFHAILEGYRNTREFHRLRLPYGPDWPTNFYMMLISELGISGIGLVILLIMGLVYGMAKLRAQNFWYAQIYMAFATLAVMWLVGIHIVFHSLILWMAFIVVACFYFVIPRLSKWCLIVSLSLLIPQSMVSLLRVKNQPSFRLFLKSQPRDPLRYREQLNKRSGQWLENGSEVLFFNERMSFLTKHPSAMYPVTITVKVFNQDKSLLGTKTFIHHESQMDEVGILKDSCLPVSKEKFCYAKFLIDKEWAWSNWDMAVFVFDP